MFKAMFFALCRLTINATRLKVTFNNLHYIVASLLPRDLGQVSDHMGQVRYNSNRLAAMALS